MLEPSAVVISTKPREDLTSEAGPNWIRTDLAGLITHLSDEAARMLRVGRRSAVGLHLPIFFKDNRPDLYDDMRAARETRHAIYKQRALKPREHGPIFVGLILRYMDETSDLLWTFVSVEKNTRAD